MSRAVEKYCRRWAAPEAALAAHLGGTFDGVVVVPALRESASLIDGVSEAAQRAGRVLCVVVVNSVEGASCVDVDANAHLLDDLARRARALRTLHDGVWTGRADGCDLFVVDRSSPGRQLPRRQGVGLARRIGCDLALEMHVRGVLRSGWIATTDADATLPVDYFSQLAALEGGHVAATFPFVHVASGDERVDTLTRRYEASLRYHLLGLHHARSPYAYHTVGSSMAVRPEAYAMAHGFPERQAAEDFYLLGKLAKLGWIARLTGSPVRVRSRASDRTPFGTGRAVQRGGLDGDVRVVAPSRFDVLGEWLRVLDRFAVDRNVEAVCAALGGRQLSGVRTHLDALGAVDELERASAQCSSSSALAARVHTWFDAFRSLKLLHAARDAGAADVPLEEALATASFVTPCGGDPSRLVELESRLGMTVGPTRPR